MSVLVVRNDFDALFNGSAFEALENLDWLARAWLAESAKREIVQYQPQLRAGLFPEHAPGGLGACNVLFATDQPEKRPLLAPGYVLPLRWQSGGGHSPHLPKEVRALGDQVLDLFAPKEKDAWGLHLNAPKSSRSLDLSAVSMPAASGFVAAAGGLLLCREGLRPRTDVFATGEWKPPFGLVRVEGLAAKLDAAFALGVKSFFVPAGGMDQEADELVKARGKALKVLPLPVGVEKPQESLAPYLAELGVPPRDEDDLKSRERYYKLLPTGKRSSDYYWDHLLDSIVATQQEQIRATYADWRPTHFVTVVSRSPELAVLGPLAVGAKRCLLLYTPDMKPWMEQVRDRLKGKVYCVEGPFSGDAHLEEVFRPLLRKFIVDLKESSNLAFDVTPGNKLMSRALDNLAPKGSSAVYLRHEFRADKRAEPGKEWLVRLPVGKLKVRIACSPREEVGAMLCPVPLLFSPQIEGGFTVTSPVFPELVTEGDTAEEAFANARDALAAVLELYAEQGRPLPAGASLSASGEVVWSDALVEAT